MRNSFSFCCFMALAVCLVPLASLSAAPVRPLPVELAAPKQERVLELARISTQPPLQARNLLQDLIAEFSLRSDEVVTAASLDLIFTPSPALQPVRSHLKVYLNNELMSVLTLNVTDLGKEVQRQVLLDPRFIKDFNVLRVELIGHYSDICEDPLHSSLWINFSAKSRLHLSTQALRVRNELSKLPEPFFDARDHSPLNLPFVFVGQPSDTQQTAAAVMASWFGARSSWRGATFPVTLGPLPTHGNALVMATNAQLPALFGSDYPAVEAATVEIMDNPADPYGKLLLILGRNDEDLLLAARALALGSIGLRGQSTTIDSLVELAPRQPYDAPNWVHADRPTKLGELMQFPQQLESHGMTPRPLLLTLNVPPDLFVWRSQGIPLDLRYRYTPPQRPDSAMLTVFVNNQFVQAFPLNNEEGNSLHQIYVPILSEGLLNRGSQLTIPAFIIGAQNQLRMEFGFGSFIAGGAMKDNCMSTIPLDMYAVVDPDSNIDFSTFYHYKALPDLHMFALSGYPFTRMADLSETSVLMPPKPDEQHLSLLFSLMGKMGSVTGYPATQLQITSNLESAAEGERDLLLLGDIPAALLDQLESKPGALIQQAKLLIDLPARIPNKGTVTKEEGMAEDFRPIQSIESHSVGNLAAMVGFQSPFGKARSVVALMAYGPEGYRLLEDTLEDKAQLDQISGSVAVMRDTGVESLQVGEQYHVGYLPWWLLLWFQLSSRPLLIAFLATLTVVVAAAVLWNTLHWLAHRRLEGHE